MKLATQRIEELSGQAEAISLTVGDLEKQRPTGPSPAEVKATLNAIPDLTETLENADDDELSELLNAFDVSVRYDKPAKSLELSAVIAPELDAPPEADRSGDSFIAGERLGSYSPLVVPVEWEADFAPQAEKRRAK